MRVDLTGGGRTGFDSPPGRVFLIGPHHTFSDLADAINVHFGRWDLAHLHEFKLADGREIGFPDTDSPNTLDHESITVSSAVAEGDRFEYVFDFGDYWEHQCEVEEVGVDPNELYGEYPELPVPIWGWGSIPDQYGRRSASDTGEDLEDL